MKKTAVVKIYSVVLLGCVVLFYFGRTATSNGEINWGVIALVATLCHFGASLRVVSEHEQAVTIIFGKIMEDLGSGLHFVPWPIRLTRATINAIKVDFGTLEDQDKERVAVADQSEIWYVMKEPIRMNFGDIQSSGLNEEEKAQYKNDPLSQRMTTDPHLYFIFRISSLRDLIREAGGLREAMERIKDTCVTALQEEAGKTFVAKANKEIDKISHDIRLKVEDLVGDPQGVERALAANKTPNRSWGVDVLEVRIKDLGTPHRANIAAAERAKTIALADGEATAVVLKAGSEKKRLQETADGKAYEIDKLATAEKNRLVREGEGKAEAFKARSEAVGENQGPLLAKLDALTTGLQYGKTVILPADASLLTAALSIKEALGATSAEPKKEG